MSRGWNLEELIGNKFGSLTIIEYAGKGRMNCTLVKCKCDCGNYTVVPCYDLVRGKRKTCGAAIHRVHSITHGKSKTRLYHIFYDMRKRCTNSKREDYRLYGGRGIKICDEWKNDFLTFEKWALSHGYADDLTLERNDVNKGYSPENCRWIPFKEQCLNKTNTVYLTYNGVKKTLMEWAKETNTKAMNMYQRRAKGYTDAEIIFGKKKLRLMEKGEI